MAGKLTIEKVLATEQPPDTLGGRVAWAEEVLDDAQARGTFWDTKLSAAEVNALRGANIEVVPAPPAGFAAVVTAIFMFLDHGGTDFVQNAGTDQLALKYNGGSEIVEIGLAATFTTFIHASVDAGLWVNFAEMALATTGALGIVPVAATAIDLDNNGAAELATGDGTLSIRVFYKLLPMSGFASD